MRTIMCIIVLLLAAIPIARAQSKEFSVYGTEELTCLSFLEAYPMMNFDHENGMEIAPEAAGVFQWVNGFRSGVNWISSSDKIDNFGGLNIPDIMRWIADYCRENPQDGAMKAMWDLYFESN